MAPTAAPDAAKLAAIREANALVASARAQLKSVTDARDDAVRRAAAYGVKTKDIAAELGVSSQRVSNIIAGRA